MKKVALFFVFLIILFVNILYAQNSGELPTLDLKWPSDMNLNSQNYGLELLFDAKAGQKYLIKAKNYYKKGYELLKSYEGVADDPNPFIRDPYSVYSKEMWNTAYRNDFSWAYNYFAKSYEIFTTKLQWDGTINKTSQYKVLLQNTIKNMILSSVYAQNYYRANDFLDLYTKLYPDEKEFGLKWKIKIVAYIIQRQQQFAIGFSGAMSVEAWRERFKKYIEEAIKNFPGDEKTKQFIRDTVLSSFSTKDFDMSTINVVTQ